MPKIAGNEIRPGLLIAHEGGLWLVVRNQAVKPGKGGAYNQVELKNVVTHTKLNTRFRADETVEETYLEKRNFQFLYASGDVLTFMDLESYDQIELPREFVGEQAHFLQDGMKVQLQLHEGKPISIALPQQVALTVTEADPVLRGQTASPGYKAAILENGLRVLVPPFIEPGIRIVVSTTDGAYVRRAE
ncbi:MAG TPA: elongation factor P [Rhizomicrobium sp.]|jgi:elongation factor P|nr:elongation factor P [Rhizomicrobium sp.]